MPRGSPGQARAPRRCGRPGSLAVGCRGAGRPRRDAASGRARARRETAGPPGEGIERVGVAARAEAASREQTPEERRRSPADVPKARPDHGRVEAAQRRRRRIRRGLAESAPPIRAAAPSWPPAAPERPSGASDSAQKTVTRPAPARSAPRAARMAAPALPREPATTASRPKSPLCESGGREAAAPHVRASASQRRAERVARARARNPDVGDHDPPARCRSPAAARGRSSARRKRPSAPPARPARGSRRCPKRGPRGRRRPRPARPAAFRTATTRRAAPASGRVSRCRRARRRHRRRRASAPREGRRPGLSRAQSARFRPRARGRVLGGIAAVGVRVPRVNTRAREPATASSRAAASPSPPLFPGPQTTTTRFQSGCAAKIASTSAGGGVLHEDHRRHAPSDRRRVGRAHRGARRGPGSAGASAASPESRERLRPWPPGSLRSGGRGARGPGPAARGPRGGPRRRPVSSSRRESAGLEQRVDRRREHAAGRPRHVAEDLAEPAPPGARGRSRSSRRPPPGSTRRPPARRPREDLFEPPAAAAPDDPTPTATAAGAPAETPPRRRRRAGPPVRPAACALAPPGRGEDPGESRGSSGSGSAQRTLRQSSPPA